MITFLVGTLVKHAWGRWKECAEAECDIVVEELWNCQGRVDAARDIAAGNMKHKVYTSILCLGSGWGDVRRVLAQYGLELELGHADYGQWPPDLYARTKGYNERIEEELDRKFGSGTSEQMRNAISEIESQGRLYGCMPP
jgi:hypothetical protein